MFARRCNYILNSRFDKIHRNPFNQGLRDGSLSKGLFNRFLIQDRLYLIALSKTHQLIGDRFSDKKYQQLFYQFAKSTRNEINMVDSLLFKSSLTENFFQCQQPKQLPVITSYIDHISYNAIHAPIPNAVASVMPCFLIYSELGKHIQPQIRHDNPYKLWIDSFVSKELETAAMKIMQIAEHLAKEGNAYQQKQMIDIFTISTDFEIAFWDSISEMGIKSTSEDTFPMRKI